ncbi:hypothetical protein [Hymenobacter sp.]|jgi:hypothetical protein|uniref:hypothetical protein n=1 Tax=Hymenobacter sp. TaxID=1898978 RepID=UPI002EDA28A5
MNQTRIPNLTALRTLLLCLLLGLSLPQLAAAQTAPDSTRVRYSEETVEEPDSARTSALKQTYNKVARLQIEEQRLWKIGLNNYTGAVSTIPVRYTRYGLYLIYEQKLRSDVSVMAELAPDFTHYRPVDGDPLRKRFSVRSQLAGRFYYNLDQRIRKGKSASNFSANYLSLAVGNGFGRGAHETPFYYYESSKPIVRADMAILYGLQRRIGQYGFVDFNVGICTKLAPEINDFGFTATLRLGLALGR